MQRGGMMKKMSWGVVFDVYLKKRGGWLWALLAVILGIRVAGLGGALLTAILVIVAGCLTTRFSFIICRNSYGAGECGEIVSRANNFCGRCRGEVPENLKYLWRRQGPPGNP